MMDILLYLTDTATKAIVKQYIERCFKYADSFIANQPEG